MLTIKIADLLGQPVGTQENYKIDTEASFDEADFKLKDKIKFDVNLIHIEGGIAAVVLDFKTKVELICNKCLRKFRYIVEIPQAERQFLLKILEEKDPNENFLIDKNKLEVDLKEMIRQEIILHFPIIPLCSKSCKGLCAKCGTDLNKKKCCCVEEVGSSEKYRPFKDLKKLIK